MGLFSSDEEEEEDSSEEEQKYYCDTCSREISKENSRGTVDSVTLASLKTEP